MPLVVPPTSIISTVPTRSVAAGVTVTFIVSPFACVIPLTAVPPAAAVAVVWLNRAVPGL